MIDEGWKTKKVDITCNGLDKLYENNSKKLFDVFDLLQQKPGVYYVLFLWIGSASDSRNIYENLQNKINFSKCFGERYFVARKFIFGSFLEESADNFNPFHGLCSKIFMFYETAYDKSIKHQRTQIKF